MTDTVQILLRGLGLLRTPAMLFLIVIAVMIYFKLKRLEEELARKAELQSLNGVGAKVRNLEKEFGTETAKTRIAVASLAAKCDAPEVIKDFLKQSTG